MLKSKPPTTNRQQQLRNWLAQPVLPVVVIDSVEESLWLAEGLQEGGIHQIEITLRTPVALEAIAAIAKTFPQMRLSAGTIRSEADFRQASEAGADLFISPGFTPVLAQAASKGNWLWIPGVANASDIMQAHEAGIDTVKFFPAMAAGGPGALSALAAALRGIDFIPTGGITVDSMGAWKRLPEVVAIGGSWLTSGLRPTATDRGVLVQRARAALEAWSAA